MPVTQIESVFEIVCSKNIYPIPCRISMYTTAFSPGAFSIYEEHLFSPQHAEASS
jgi:hypothetical protein